MPNRFDSLSRLTVGGRTYCIHRLDALEKAGILRRRLPFSLSILLENLLRNEDGTTVTDADIRALGDWNPKAEPSREIAFRPARVLMQDFTGVPAVVDLAAMRDAMARLGGDPTRIDPLEPVELVIDHSVQVDVAGSPGALARNADLEYRRNRERYVFLRWGQDAFRNFRVVPPETGIVHQVNVEHLARVVFTKDGPEGPLAYPDTLVGTDSHTTMVNGMGVLGWGCGGIEAEAAMLGQPVSMLIPQVVGVRLVGEVRDGATATDVVLTVTEVLRKHGVVGKFVEFFGPGLRSLGLADRATIANMCPEYGATCALFPIDDETLRYLRLTGRPDEQAALVEAYCRAQGLYAMAGTPDAEYTEVVPLDLGTVVPSLAGPRRPQDRVRLRDVKRSFEEALPGLAAPKTAKGEDAPAVDRGATVRVALEGGPAAEIGHGAVVIAAITSCTNTSNPSVLLAAGLLAKKARDKGLRTKPWVKASLAPGSRVVTEYLARAGLIEHLEALRFHVVGYGCTTCIGNSGPLAPELSQAVEQGGLVVAAVLSGNRNFEGRIHPEVRANYLASPPLVVAYALAGRIDIDLERDPLGTTDEGRPVLLRDVWPSPREVADAASCIRSEMYRTVYARVFEGDERWRQLPVPSGAQFAWDASSTYVRHPPYFASMSRSRPEPRDIAGARVLCLLGDSVTTDHISPAGSIRKDGPAGRYLVEHGVDPRDFNSYGSRRGNHEVMVRGTFANVRLRNRLAPGTEGGVTRHLPAGETMSIFDAAERYRAEGVPLIVVAGKEYGSGSSRDWAAKGPALLGVRAVLAESFERIHRSNLVGLGIAPLEFPKGQTAESLGITGEEVYDIVGLAEGALSGFAGGRTVEVRVRPDGSAPRSFRASVRIDTPQEAQYWLNDGILQYVLRQRLG